MSDIELELSRIAREAEANVRRGQRGDAFVEVAKDIAAGKLPLLTTLVPSGMPNLLDRKVPEPKPTLRRKAVTK